jgi:hypothetical protein
MRCKWAIMHCIDPIASLEWLLKQKNISFACIHSNSYSRRVLHGHCISVFISVYFFALLRNPSWLRNLLLAFEWDLTIQQVFHLLLHVRSLQILLSVHPAQVRFLVWLPTPQLWEQTLHSPHSPEIQKILQLALYAKIN